MPGAIEQRILEMRFNNTDFERKANQSINTLDRLDKSMQLESSGVGFDKLAPMIEAVTNKFSILGTVGDQIIRRITDSVINLTNRMVGLAKSLSVDQITAGWSKYADKTSAVQTIMAATSKDWEDTGAQMEFVNDQLEKLNWFTDETSYSFLDMVNNIGKFTSNGVKLEDSVVAMQGISTWAALSGAGIQGASRAMYNLSQALAVGSVKLIDWKSIENANMATREFKETALATAVNLGTLTKAADGSYRTLQGHVFTIEQFNTQLSDGWFSSEVLMKTLDQYGAFSVKLREVSEETGYTATELLQAIEVYKDTKQAAPELAGYLEELSAKEYALGLKAFKAAQEAKTFQEAIDATKDAVSTGWMNTFETIFGTYDEAKELWTDFANGLYDVFAEGGNERNRILKEWRQFPIEIKKSIDHAGLEEWEGPSYEKMVKYIDGRKILIDAFKNIGNSFVSVLDTIKEAFHDIFPKTTAADLIRLTQNFARFTRAIKPSEEALEKLRRILRGVFAIFDIGRMAISSLASIFMDKLFPSIKNIGGNLFDATANFSDWIVKIRDSIKENDTFGKKLESLSGILSKVIGWLKDAKTAVSDFVKTFLGLKEGETVWGKIGNGIQKLGEIAGKAFSKVREFLDGVFGGEKFNSSNLIKTLGGALAAFFGFKKISGIGKKNPIEQLLDFLKGFKEGFFENISKGLEKVSNAFAQFTHNTPADQLKKIAISIGILAAALFVLAKLDSNKLGLALLGITTAMGEMLGMMKLLGKTGPLKGNAASTMIKIALAVLIMSLAVAVFSKIDFLKLIKGLGAMALTMGALVLAISLIGKYVQKNIGGLLAAGAAMIGMSMAMLIMAAAIAIFSLIPFDKLAKGIGAMAVSLLVMMGALILLSKFGGNAGKILAAGVAILLVAGAMILLTASVAALAMIPMDKLTNGVIALATILLAVSLALGLLSKYADPVGMIAAAAAMLVVSAAIAILVAAIAGLVLLFTLNSEATTTAIIVFVGLLIVLTIAVAALGAVGPMALLGAAALLVVAAAMAIASAAIVILSIGLNMLNGLPIAAIAGGLALIGASMIVLGVGGLIAGLGVVGYAGLIVLGLGLSMLTGLDLVGMAGGLALLGAAFIPLGIGGLILGVGAAGMLAGSIGMAAIGLAMIPLAAGLHALDGVDQETILKFLEVLAISIAALAGLGAIAEVFSVGLLALGTACLEVGAGIALAGQGLQDIVNALGNIPTGVGRALLDMGDGIRQALKVTRNDATKELEAMMKDLVKAVSDNSKSVTSEAEKMSSGLLDGSKKYNSEIISSFGELINSCLNAITTQESAFNSAMGNILSSCYTRIVAFVPMFTSASMSLGAGLSSGLRNVSLSSSLYSLLNSAVYTIRGYYSSFYNAGYYLVVGLRDGISNNAYLAISAVRSMAIQMNNTFRAYNAIKSPSKLYAKTAGYIPMGVAKGVEDNAGVAEDAVEDMGYGMITAISPALAILQGIVNDQFDINPTIRPTVDLSDITESSAAINGLFTNGTVGVSTAADISGRMGGIESARITPEARSSASTFSPVINNYIYTQPGQDTAAIADEVERRMVRSLTQRKVAFVNR